MVGFNFKSPKYVYPKYENRRFRSIGRGLNIPTVTTDDKYYFVTAHVLPAFHSRPCLAENYEKPKSGRETWWRCTIKPTPLPGAYRFDDFLDSLQKRPNTYRFKGDGRSLDPQPHAQKGALLLPGAYNHQDFISLKKQSATYSFKDTGREYRDMGNFGRKDKDIDVAPDAYKVEDHLNIKADKEGAKLWQFKSQCQRFPTVYFKPKEGPPPGRYDAKHPHNETRISSSFLSRTPRFSTSHTKTPGPGSYDKMFQFPMPSTVARMGRDHGVYFTSAHQM